MTCQNLQNKLLNITVLFIWYLLQIVGEFKKNVIRQTWQTLFHFGKYLFQSTRHFGECLKNMVSHTVIPRLTTPNFFIPQLITIFFIPSLTTSCQSRDKKKIRKLSPCAVAVSVLRVLSINR
jgi:hypothetical protein